MEVRKLQKVGNRSYSLCLPKTWVKSHGLKEKDGVFIEVNRKNELIVKTGDKTSKRPSHISADISKISDIMEFLVFCYVRNVDKVTLHTANAGYKKVSQVKSMIKYLDGYDITSEDENMIEITFLFKDVNINLDNIRRRMIYLISNMVKSIEMGENENLEEIETNIDRLYHLSKRIMFSCIGNMQAKEENGVNSDEDLFFLNLIFKKMENMADSIYSLREAKLSQKEIDDMKKMIDLINGLFNMSEKTEKVKDVLFDMLKRYSSARGNAGTTIHKIADLCKDITENVISLRFDLDYFGNGNS